MKKYIVYAQIIEDEELEVKARNKKEAIKKAEKLIWGTLYGAIELDDVEEIED